MQQLILGISNAMPYSKIPLVEGEDGVFIHVVIVGVGDDNSIQLA
jgi:hypothetical protein